MKNFLVPLSALATCAVLACASGSGRAQGFAFLIEQGGTHPLQADRSSFAAWDLGPRGSLQHLVPGALAWDELGDRLWMLSRASGELVSIQPWDGALASHAFLGAGSWYGFCRDEASAAFYALRNGRELWRIDPATFAAQLLGDLGSWSLHDLVADAGGGLFALQDVPPALVSIDVAARSAQVRIALAAACSALAIDPASGALIAARSNDLRLYEIDVATGFLRLLGALTGIAASPIALAVPGCRGTVANFGRGCDGGLGAPLHVRLRGLPCLAHRMSVILENDRPPGPIYYVRGHTTAAWGPIALPFDLGVIGAPGCAVLHPHDILVGPLLTGLYHSQAVPRSIVFVGTLLHWQAYSFAPGVPNVLGVASSDAVRISLGW